MKNLSVSIEEELFRKVKIKTAQLGISLKEYVLRLIKEDFEKEQKEK